MNNKTIKELNELYRADKLTPELVNLLKTDSRQGVKKIVKKYENQLEKEQVAAEEFFKLKSFDYHYKNEGIKLIAGIDEAGRGPLAGPVVAASVILPDNFELLGLTDSKQISEKNRLIFYNYIVENAVSYHIEIINESAIDQMNIYQATILAMKGAYQKLLVKPDYLLIDAVDINVKDISYDPIIKGDAKSLSIAAASILAKVTRDKIMLEYDELYPEYKFKQHMGYGTKDHLLALESYGICPIHRKSFSPVKEIIKADN